MMNRASSALILSLGLLPAAVSAQDVPVAAEPPTDAQTPPSGDPAAALEVIAVDPALDAETEAAPTRAASSNRMVEEILVTAQKREESLQEVPISIQAFSPEALDARGVTQVTGLGEVVPGLQFTDVVGFTLVYLRGVGTDSFSPSSDPSVATYIDGVYLPAGHGVHQELGGIKRVEVLKGPQGTLFGRNSTGGAISIVTEEPSRDEPRMNMELSAGNFSARGLKGDVSMPLTDWLSFGVAGLYQKADPYNTQTRFAGQEYVSKAARFKLNIHPYDNWEIGLTYLNTGQISYAGTTSENTEPSLLSRTVFGIQPSEEDRDSDQDVKGVLDSGQDIFYGHFSWNLPSFDVKLIGSDVRNDTRFAQTDFDGSSQPVAAFNAFGNFAE